MHSPMPLAGRTALITGGARRLGRALCCALADAGANVVVHYHQSESEARGLVAELEEKGGRAWSICADLSNAEEVDALAGLLPEQASDVDILINNASIFPEDKLGDLNAESFQHNMQINALAPFQLARSIVTNGGDVINLLDARMDDHDKEHISYHLSKRMLFNLTRLMAVEFAPKVRVNAVAPGLILPPEGKDEGYLNDLAHTNPLQTHGEPEDVVGAALFLLQSPFVTGQVIFVDGGRHMRGSLYG